MVIFPGDVIIQGKLVPKLTNLQSYLFQAYTSLKPSRDKQNYKTYLSKMAKTNY